VLYIATDALFRRTRADVLPTASSAVTPKVARALFVLAGAACGFLVVKGFMLDWFETVAFHSFFANLSPNMDFGLVLRSMTLWKLVAGAVAGGLAGLAVARVALRHPSTRDNTTSSAATQPPPITSAQPTLAQRTSLPPSVVGMALVVSLAALTGWMISHRSRPPEDADSNSTARGSDLSGGSLVDSLSGGSVVRPSVTVRFAENQPFEGFLEHDLRRLASVSQVAYQRPRLYFTVTLHRLADLNDGGASLSENERYLWRHMEEERDPALVDLLDAHLGGPFGELRIYNLDGSLKLWKRVESGWREDILHVAIQDQGSTQTYSVDMESDLPRSPKTEQVQSVRLEFRLIRWRAG